MPDPKESFLMNILDFYAARDSSGYVLSKISAISTKENHIFCINCAHLYIPNVNCKTKSDDKKFKIECNKCKNVLVFEKNVD
jgi:hypothetical protein